MIMKKDIETRADIIVLMDQFYEKIKVNTLLRPIFVDVAQLDFDAHMPILYDFWCTLLLGDMSYTRNAMEVHISLHRKSALTNVHFDEWLRLFNDTADELYSGEKVSEAKYRAKSIAGLMLYKVETEGNKIIV